MARSGGSDAWAGGTEAPPWDSQRFMGMSVRLQRDAALVKKSWLARSWSKLAVGTSRAYKRGACGILSGHIIFGRHVGYSLVGRMGERSSRATCMISGLR